MINGWLKYLSVIVLAVGLIVSAARTHDKANANEKKVALLAESVKQDHETIIRIDTRLEDVEEDVSDVKLEIKGMREEQRAYNMNVLNALERLESRGMLMGGRSDLHEMRHNRVD